MGGLSRDPVFCPTLAPVRDRFRQPRRRHPFPSAVAHRHTAPIALPEPCVRPWIERFLRFYFAHWHLRQMPPAADPESRRRRLVWCRDNCGNFAGRWLGTCAVLWVVAFTPVGAVLPAEAGYVLPVAALVSFVLGMWHMVWQIWAQSRVGLPPIDPPVQMRRPEEPDEDEGRQRRQDR